MTSGYKNPPVIRWCWCWSSTNLSVRLQYSSPPTSLLIFNHSLHVGIHTLRTCELSSWYASQAVCDVTAQCAFVFLHVRLRKAVVCCSWIRTQPDAHTARLQNLDR